VVGQQLGRVLTEPEVWCTAWPFWTPWRREKSLPQSAIEQQFPVRPARSIFTILTELLWFHS